MWIINQIFEFPKNCFFFKFNGLSVKISQIKYSTVYKLPAMFQQINQLTQAWKYNVSPTAIIFTAVSFLLQLHQRKQRRCYDTNCLKFEMANMFTLKQTVSERVSSCLTSLLTHIKSFRGQSFQAINCNDTDNIK